MNNEEHSAILKQGVECWNQWRRDNPDIVPQLSNYDWNDFNLSGINLSQCELTNFDFRNINLSGANFTQAFLLKADFAFSNLTNTNFTNAELRHSDFTQAQLNNTIFDHAHLSYAHLSYAEFNKTKFRGANLRQTELKGLDLSDLDFSNANLSDLNLNWAKFIRANLSGANLSRSQVLWTDFTAANLTGACIEDWNATRNTNLSDVICDYIYLRQGQQERRPSSGEFAPGEFTKLSQKALETVDLIFADGIDWKAFLLSFQELQGKYGEENLSVQAIEKKSGGAFVIRLEVPPEAIKADIESQAKELYEIQRKALEARYHAELQAKDEQIVIYRQQNATLEKVINILGTRPIQNIINVTANAESNSMSESYQSKYDQRNSNNQFVDTAQSGSNPTFNQYNYTPEQKKTLAEAASEIQKLLKQLEETNPTATEAEKVAYVNDETTPSFKHRVIGAFQAGGETAIDEFILENKYLKVAKAAIKGWLQPGS